MTGILKVDQWKDSGDNALMTSDGAGNLTVNTDPTFTKSGATTAVFNRTTSEGTIIELQKDGSTIGNIGTNFSSAYYTGSNSGMRFGNNGFPTNGSGANNDNAVDLGISSVRWKDFYLAGNIYLGGTGAANALDDYEEGTFTPTLEGSSGNPTVTYARRYGRYTKIGDTVTFQCCIKLSALSGGSGEVLIDGLPFSPADIESFQHPTFTTFIVQKPNTDIYTSLVFASSKIFFRRVNSTTDDSMPFSAVDGDTGFFVTGNYKTNS